MSFTKTLIFLPINKDPFNGRSNTGCRYRKHQVRKANVRTENVYVVRFDGCSRLFCRCGCFEIFTDSKGVCRCTACGAKR